MNATMTAAAVMGLMATAAQAGTTKWDVDVAHSEVGFKVRHLMVSNTKGAFNAFSGALELDDKDVTKSKVSITIEAKSIDTNSKDRDDHLRGPDFFDAEKFPKVTFESTKVEQVGGRLKVSGNLTMHGVTKPVVLDAEPLSAQVKDPWGGLRTGTRATVKVDRREFGLTWNKALEAGGIAVGNDVEISLEVEFQRKP